MPAVKSARSPEVFGKVVAEFTPLRDSPAGELHVRVLEVRGTRRLDVRQFVTTSNFSGFTKRGISLSLEEVESLFGQRDEILAALEDRAPSRGAVKRRRARTAAEPAATTAEG